MEYPSNTPNSQLVDDDSFGLFLPPTKIPYIAVKMTSKQFESIAHLRNYHWYEVDGLKLFAIKSKAEEKTSQKPREYMAFLLLV